MLKPSPRRMKKVNNRYLLVNWLHSVLGWDLCAEEETTGRNCR